MSREEKANRAILRNTEPGCGLRPGSDAPVGDVSDGALAVALSLHKVGEGGPIDDIRNGRPDLAPEVEERAAARKIARLGAGLAHAPDRRDRPVHEAEDLAD